MTTPLMEKKLDIECVMNYILNRARVYLFCILDLSEFDFRRGGIDGFRLREAINDYYTDQWNQKAKDVILSAQGILPDIIDGSISTVAAVGDVEEKGSRSLAAGMPESDSETPAEDCDAQKSTQLVAPDKHDEISSSALEKFRSWLRSDWPPDIGPLNEAKGVSHEVRRAIWGALQRITDEIFDNARLRDVARLKPTKGDSVSRCLSVLVDKGILKKLSQGTRPAYEFNIDFQRRPNTQSPVRAC